MTVEIRDNVNALENSSNKAEGYSIELTLVSTDSANSGLILGNYAATATSSGTVTFTNFRILSSGSFKIMASSDSAITNSYTTTDTYTIQNFPKSITITASSSTVTAYESYMIDAHIYGDDDMHYVYASIDATLEGSDFTAVNSVLSSTTGEISSYSLYTSASGSKTYTVSVPGKDSSTITSSGLTITVVQAILSVSFDVNPTDSSAHTFLIKVLDTTGVTTLSNANEISIGLSIVCDSASTCSGNVTSPTLSTSNTVNGVATINSFRILSSGVFNIEATQSDMVTDFIITGTIVNYVKSIHPVASLSISANFNSVIEVNLLGDDDLDFLLAADVVITPMSNLASTSLTSSTSTGFTNLTVWFTLAGTYTLTLTSQAVITSVGPITVLENKIIMTGPTPVPKTSIAVFTLVVSVTANDGVTVESLHGPYTIGLTPSPNSGILSLSSLETTNGVASINTIMTTDGTYTITVSTPNMDTLVTSSFTTIDVLSSITVADSDLSQPNKHLILLPVTLVNNHALLYLHSATLTLTCSGVTALSNSISTSNATATFYMYFTTTGSKSCSIGGVGTTDSGVTITKTFTMVITDATSVDPECNIDFTSTTCFICVANAKMNLLNSCDCSRHSVYNSVTNKCECDETYTESKNFCVQCGNYYSPSELVASYAADYKSFSIVLARPVSASTKATCANSVILPESLSSLNPTCVWVSSSKLTYVFTDPVKDNILSIIVDPNLVQAMASTCNYDVKGLYISISTPYPAPVPIAKIVAPSSVSIACTTDDILVSVSSSSINTDYKYAWTAVISPANSGLSIDIGSVTSSSFKIASSRLSASTITLTLKVTSKTFGTSSSASTSITITTDSILGVSFNVGSSFSITQIDLLSIEAKISEPCGTVSPYSYDWSYTSDSSAPVFNMTDLLATTTKSNSFLTTPGFMFAGHTYVFTVVASAQNITGTAVLSLTIDYRPLVLKLDRTSGSVGLDRDLVIFSTYSDPDNTAASITITWNCVSEGAMCEDPDGNALVDGFTSYALSIPASKLTQGAYYTITATASTSTSTASTSVDIQVDETLKGELKLSPIDELVPNNYKYTIRPKIQSDGDSTFTWQFNPDPNSSIEIKLNKPYLVIPPEYLTSGQIYSLTLSMTSPTGGTLTTFVSFLVNSPPLCNNFTAELNVENRWVLTGEDCGDNDSNDMVIFQYGILIGEIQRWISLPTYSNSITLRLSKNTEFAIMRVCDRFRACSLYDVNITSIQPGRRLSVLSDFQTDIENPDMIPSSIVYYAELIEDQETYDFIYDTMYEYFTTQFLDENTLELFLDCLNLMFENSTFVIGGNYSTNATDFANYIMVEYSQDLLDAQVESILNTLGAYVDYIDRYSLNTLLNSLGSLWIGDSSIDTYIEYIGYITLIRNRLASADLQGQEIVIDTTTIALPDDLPVTPDLIYDIQYSKYRAEDDYMEFTFFTAGTYVSYTVVLETPKEIEIIPITPIQISIGGVYDSSQNYECKVEVNSTWEDGGCTVNSITDTEAVIDILHESVYVLRINNNSCKVGRGPIAAMSVLIFLMILLIIIFTLVDRDFKNMPYANFMFLLHYPLTSICFKQPRPRRPTLTLQLFTCELLMLALIGAFHNHFDSATQDYEAKFDDYYGRQLSRGAAGWALTQVFTVPIFFLNAFTASGKKYYYITIPACIVISVLSFIAVVVMTTQYCAGYTTYWMANFLIFLLFDLVTLQVIYSLIISKILPGKEEKADATIDKEKKHAKGDTGRTDRAGRTGRPSDDGNNEEHDAIHSNSGEVSESYYEVVQGN